MVCSARVASRSSVLICLRPGLNIITHKKKTYLLLPIAVKRDQNETKTDPASRTLPKRRLYGAKKSWRRRAAASVATDMALDRVRGGFD
jgi:hypothetical protein